MEKEYLNLEETIQMFRAVAQSMIEHTDLLTKADQAIGDGDHGTGMRRGFSATLILLEENEFTTLAQMIKQIGYALMNSTGGASGVIFGTLFIGGAKELKEKEQFDADSLRILLTSGLAAVKQRGKAQPGDKTVVDALEPAASATADHSSLQESITAVVSAAEAGMEETKTMIAHFGRAKSLGEKAIGHADPGSISMFLLLKAMKEYIITARSS